MDVAKCVKQWLDGLSDLVMCPIVRGPGVDWRIVFGCSSDESILANSPVDINDMAWRTFHRGDRGLPVSRLEHAAHAHGRFRSSTLFVMSAIAVERLISVRTGTSYCRTCELNSAARR
jgi:hypothetical protein